MGLSSVITICIITISGILLIFGVNNILYHFEENKCDMTWMYEYPKYIKVDLNLSVQKMFPKYSLFIYGEGRYADQLKRMNGDYKLDGVPVIFVHGNAGRYKQVRSPGSISYTKSQNRKHHFNYFSVDYEEELSALYGPYLQQQTHFLYYAISRVLQCYDHLKENKRPSSIIAIGHSMGGVVIRGLLTLPEFNVNLISTIVTLATPQREPTILLDHHIDTFYNEINTIWMKESSRKFKNITFLSLGGGFRDFLVRSDLCLFNNISLNEHHYSSLTSSIPMIWLENDHQCIVWCNQLVRALTRAFYNMIDPIHGQIQSNPVLRSMIFSSTLLHQNLGAKRFKGKLDNCKQLKLKENKIVVIEKAGCYWLPVLNDLESLLNVWILTSRTDWSFTCNSSGQCLSSDSQTFLPGTQTSQFRQIYGTDNSKKIMLKTKNKERVLIERLSRIRPFLLYVPFFTSYTETYKHLTESFFTDIHLIGLIEPWQTYEVTLTFNSNIRNGITIVKIVALWSNESYVYSFSSHETVRFPIKMFTNKQRKTGNFPQIQIWHESISNITVNIKPALSDCVGQILRFNIDVLIRYSLVFNLLMTSTFKATKMKLFGIGLTYLFIRYLLVVPTISRYCSYYTFIKVVLPETYLLMSAYAIAKVLTFVIHLLLRLVYFITTFPRKVMAPLLAIQPQNTYKLACTLVGITTLVYIFISHGVSPILVILLFTHVIKIFLAYEIQAKTYHVNSFIAVLPIILLFIIIPLIVYVQDIVNGFNHQHGSFRNLDVLAVTYSVYLLYIGDGPDFGNSGLFQVHPVCFTVFMFRELIPFYNLTYLVVTYTFVHIFIYYFVSNHKKIE